MQTGRTLLFGFFVWLTAFVGAMFIFPFHENNRILFETLMSVILTTGTVFWTVVYLKKVDGDFAAHSLKAGVIWMLVNLALDFPVFIVGPLARPITDYVFDIGLMYPVIPVITFGMGYVLDKKRAKA